MLGGHDGTPLDWQSLGFGGGIELVNERSMRPSHDLG
jgi:hypothetical protein